MAAHPYLQALDERIIVFDGAFGTFVQDLDLGADDFGGPSLEGCNEMLCLTRPDVIASMHEAFFSVGVDAVETASFGSFSTVLAEYDVSHQAHEMNVAAARIAREVADGFAADGRPRFVAGSIGPGTKLPSLGHIDFATLRDSYQEQADGLLEGGVDLFLIETCMDLLQVKAAMIGCRRAMQSAGREVPLQVQVTMETTGRMLVGSEIGAALTSLLAMRPDVLGINCATGPSEMQEHLRYLSQHSPIPISVLPNAGLPSVVDGRTHYDLTPPQLAEFHRHHVQDLGIGIVGGCCGTTPEHLRQVVAAVRDLEPPRRTANYSPSVSSIYSPVTLEQDLSFLIIGERTNANGSKAFREAMLAADWDTCTKMANEQVREGAHVIDVCVDYVGRDGAADMDEIAKRFATQASVPLVIDSTETPVLEAALQHIGGRAILNSANLEDGELPDSRFDRVMRLAREYGCAVICLLIDERGQARDVEWKMEIAHRIHEIAVERYGLSASDLIFDALTFPLSTGDDDLRRDAMHTMEAITRIKAEIPGCFTTLGVSNVSFGLNPAARHALNSVFLHECVQAGLDSAIVHAGKIVPLNRLPDEQKDVCLDLIYDRRGTRDDGTHYDPLQELLEVFADVKSTATAKPDRSGLPVGERLHHRIIDGDRDGLTADLDEALASGMPALAIVNDVLLGGMKVVGELFGSGQMQLPFVLQSAETMKQAVAHLEPHMEKVDGGSAKGKLVLATVKGDVHDIGKNLVDIICTNNGYEVHNIGIKVAIGEMVAKVKEVDADALGMSGLLVKSTLIMRENLEELNNLGLTELPVLLGGAALTRRYVERDLREVYDGRVFYGKDAFEGLSTLDSIMTMKRSGDWDPDFGRVPTGRELPEREGRDGRGVDGGPLPRRSPDVATDNPVFTPPFLGSKVVKGLPLDDIARYVNETALYRNQWQFRPETDADGTTESDDDFKARIRPIFREQLAAAKASGVLVPQVVYGYFAVNGDGDDLVVWTDDTRTTEQCRFSYPRQQQAPFMCIADFFRPIESGETDYAAFHIVTMGAPVSEAAAKLFEANEYQQYLLLHGIGVEMAEALAEYWHHRIRTEWGFVDEDGPSIAGLFRQQYRSGRYSWGYPACPDLEDNATVGQLLGAERLGIEVSEETGWQYQPEQTTSALICHHPQAKYFVAR